MFMENWMEKQVWSLMHQMDENDNILKWEEFNVRYNLNFSSENYIKVTKNLPAALVQLLKNNLDNIPMPKL